MKVQKLVAICTVVTLLLLAGACGKRRPPPKVTPPPAPVVDPPKEEIKITAGETGAIWFICSNGHEEWEAIVDKCPSCGSNNDFYVDQASNAFVCRACKKTLPSEKIVCDKCGAGPGGKRVKIKHR